MAPVIWRDKGLEGMRRLLPGCRRRRRIARSRRIKDGHTGAKITISLASPDQIPKKSKSPLVIPCKFSAVTYSERLSGTHSVARRILRISVENKDLHSARVSGAERERARTPSAAPLVARLRSTHRTRDGQQIRMAFATSVSC